MTEPPSLPRPNRNARITLSAISDGYTLLMQQTTAWILVSLVLLAISLSIFAFAMIPAVLIAGGFDPWQRQAVQPLSPAALFQTIFMLPASAWLGAAPINV